MNITKENIDDLNAVVRVNLVEEDYQTVVSNVLKDYRKKASVPGFRPGMVPMGMIKKMYGKSVLVEQLNKLATDSLYNYLSENKIEVLGNPLPKNDEIKFDLDKDKAFEFVYDLGLAPNIDVKVSSKDKFEKLDIKVDDTLLSKNINDITKRYGKVGDADKSADGDMIQGDFRELDGKELKEGGIFNTSTIALEFIKDEKAKKALIGKKLGDKITVDPFKVSKGGADTAAMLNVPKEEIDSVKSKFEFEVKKVYRVEAAELNQELFDKAFGKDVIKSEEEFKAKLTEELSGQLENESKRKLQNDIIEKLLDKAKLDLPDEFLKKWLVATNEEMTTEKAEEQYNDYSIGLRWQLIQNKLIKDNDIKVEHAEVVESAKGLIRAQMAQYGMSDLPEEELDQTAARVLQNQEEAQRIYQQIYDEKLLNFFMETVTLKNKEVSYDDFVKLASAK